MATYEYQCPSCGKQIEVEHGMKETPKVCCPVCAPDTAMTRLVSAAPFKLKGKGWAKDGYQR